MSFRQLFFIENQLIGEASRGYSSVHRTGAPPMSDLYFCRFCGEVFAKFPCLSLSGAGTPWQSYRSVCRKCKPPHTCVEIPGSIWRGYDTDFTDALPLSVLRWELDRHLEEYERGYKA